MLEGILMVSVLAAMGVYFVKSTDLPSELKERQKIIELEGSNKTTSKKFNFERRLNSIKESDSLDLEINDLTLRITTLEQELSEANSKTREIEAELSLMLNKLSVLVEKKNSIKNV